MLCKSLAQLCVFFGRQIDDNSSVYARRFGFCGEGSIAHVVDGIAITHNDERRRVIRLSKFGRHI